MCPESQILVIVFGNFNFVLLISTDKHVNQIAFLPLPWPEFTSDTSCITHIEVPFNYQVNIEHFCWGIRCRELHHLVCTKFGERLSKTRASTNRMSWIQRQWDVKHWIKENANWTLHFIFESMFLVHLQRVYKSNINFSKARFI